MRSSLLASSSSSGTQGWCGQGSGGQGDVHKKVSVQREEEREPGEATGAAGVHMHQGPLTQQMNHG